MVFQSEREEGNPFYQIYLLDLETGDQERVSPGHGQDHAAPGFILMERTSCSPARTWMPQRRPSRRPSMTNAPANRVRKYSWDYDEHFNLFAYSLTGKSMKQITTAKGYDAEAAARLMAKRSSLPATVLLMRRS